MAHILLIIVLFDNLKRWLDRPFNFLYMHSASQVCNVSRYSLKMAKFSTLQNGRLAPLMRKTISIFFYRRITGGCSDLGMAVHGWKNPAIKASKIVV